MTDIRPAELPRDLEVVRGLFAEYAESLGVDLGFQGFERELAELPGKYRRRPGGCSSRGTARGRSAHRAAPPGCRACEMKRLYVRPEARGERLGRRLVERICREAREAGYARICLDTLPMMASAQALYESLGFVPIEPYVFNPVPGTKFLALDL